MKVGLVDLDLIAHLEMRMEPFCINYKKDLTSKGLKTRRGDCERDVKVRISYVR